MVKSKKKIAYIVNSLNLGGTERLVVQMSNAFKDFFDIHVICLDEPGLWANELRGKNISVYCFWRHPGIDISIAVKIARFCKDKKIDLIHAHQSTPWFYSALSRFLYSAPKLLFEEHGRHYPERYSRKKNVVNRVVIQRLTSKVVAVSEDVKKRLAKYEGLSEDCISVIYNGTQPPEILQDEKKQAIRKSFGFDEKTFLIGTVGRLDQIKNLPMLLKAIAAGRGKNKTIKCLLVGDGPEREKLTELAAALNIEDDIVFAGYRADATALLQCMNLFVLCSFSEGTSMALLEAMAAGVPAVVTNVGGNPELIRHGENGWVIPSDAEADLAAVIDEAFHSPETRLKLAKMASVHFHEKFSFERMVEKYHYLYRDLTGANE